MKTYTKEEMKALVAEFSAEFDTLVKAEVAKTGAALKKSEDGSDDKKDAPPADKASEGSESAPAESAPPAGPPAADASAAPAESAAPPAADPAASAAPADPASQAAGTDPVSALVQAYGSLAPEELQFHIQALQQVVQSQGAGAAAPAAAPPMGAGAPPAPPAADPAMSAAPMAAAPAVPPAAAPPAGPDAVAPLAGEGSKPVDPAATLALKSERDSLLGERDALRKSVEQLTDTLSKAISRPEVKSISAEDLGVDLAKSETPKYVNMTKAEITKKLVEVARDEKLKKSDRDLINKLYKGEVKVEALAHLLG